MDMTTREFYHSHMIDIKEIKYYGLEDAGSTRRGGRAIR
jgi:hypothetical protein